MRFKHFMVRFGEDLIKALCGGHWEELKDLTPFPGFTGCTACRELLIQEGKLDKPAT